ncbi:hypothetical protein D3C72_1843280 [compost metagenome]
MRVVRVSRLVLNSASSRATCWLTTALVMPRRSAAAVKLPVSTTAAKYASRLRLAKLPPEASS